MTEKKSTKKEVKASKSDSMVEVISSRGCRIANKDFSYNFVAGVKKSVKSEHLEALLKTKIIKEAE